MPSAKKSKATLLNPKLSRAIERLKPDMVDFLKRYVAIGTVNPPGENYLTCVRFLEGRLKKLGLKTKIVCVPKKAQAKLAPGLDDYPRYGLIARWDVGARKTLHYTGHYDVVPPTSGWHSDPFKPFVKGKKLFGRGSSDMKASGSAIIHVVNAMQTCAVVPPWNIELSFTPDEETGGRAGLGYLVKSKAIKPDAAVLCEGGSGDNICYAHRGVLWLDITVLGKPGHASNPKNGINALEKACFLIGELKKLERVYAKRTSSFMAAKFARRPTLMIGGVSGGGGKTNTIPDRFHFTIDRRLLPEEKLSKVKAEIMAVIRSAQAKDKKLKVKVAYPLHVEPGWTDPSEPICRVALEAHRAVTRRRGRFQMTGGFTDMHWLTNDGKVPTVGFGVQGGGAHADDEYALIPSMVEAAKVYAEIALRMGTTEA